MCILFTLKRTCFHPHVLHSLALTVRSNFTTYFHDLILFLLDKSAKLLSSWFPTCPDYSEAKVFSSTETTNIIVTSWIPRHATSMKSSAFLVCYMYPPSIRAWKYRYPNSSAFCTKWDLQLSKELYGSQVFFLIGQLTACTDVQPISSPLKQNTTLVMVSSTPVCICPGFYVTIPDEHIIVLKRKTSQTDSVPKLPMLSTLWSKRWNFKMKTMILQYTAEVSTTLFLSGLLFYSKLGAQLPSRTPFTNPCADCSTDLSKMYDCIRNSHVRSFKHCNS